ncbi:hypothetical protein [Sorangium sp. So ce131]|uniref:hypothetical protein n=1 Tax=Sorangium sp. So ce131 TaxID=3133282 RepID=UPI003F5E517B
MSLQAGARPATAANTESNRLYGGGSMKSNRSIHLALVMGALAAAPALAAAQTGSTSPPQQRESSAAGGAQPQQGNQAGAAGGAQQHGNQPGASGAQQHGASGAQQHGASGAQPQQGNQGGAASGRHAQQHQQQGQKKKAMKLEERVSFAVEDGCTYTATVNGKLEPAAAGRSQQPSGGQPGGGSQGRGGTGAQGQTGGVGQGPAGEGSQARAGGAQGGSQGHAGGAQAGGTEAGGAQAGGAQAGSAQAGGAQAGGQSQSGDGDRDRVKPNLTVSASISCPNTADLQVTDTLKTDTPITRSELEDMLSRRASIATQRGGRFCMIVPDFELTSERLTSRGVTQLCRTATPPQKHGMR